MSSSGPHRVARPAARYRPGKAPVQGETYDDDEDSADESTQRRQPVDDEKPESITDFKSFTSRPASQRRTAGVVVNLGSDRTGPPTTSLKPKVEEPEFDSDEYETDTGSEEEDVKRPDVGTSRPAVKAAETESEYETDSGEEEDSSEEEEEEVKPMFKPMFVPKSQRQGATPAQPTADPKGPSLQSGDSSTVDDLQAKAEAEAQKRRLESQRLAGERIKLELLEKQAVDSKPDLDDTDDLDPEAEFAAWRLRELQRIKRQWEREIKREEEEEERRKREALTEEEKLKLDTVRAAETRRKKDEERGKMGFMQKYYHKGAFFQDLDILKKHDYSTGQTEGTVDISKLPKVMQVRDYGKRGRSKYTHLADEDTTRKADPRPKRGEETSGGPSNGSGSSSGCFHCGSPDHRKKDCPVLTAEKEKESQERRRQYQQQRSQEGGGGGDRTGSRRRGEFRRPHDYDDPSRGPRDTGWESARRSQDDPRARSPPSRRDYDQPSRRFGDGAKEDGGRYRDRDRDRERYSDRHYGDESRGGAPVQEEKVKDRWTLRKEAEARAVKEAAAASAGGQGPTKASDASSSS